MTDYRAAIVDLDGTVWRGDTPLPDADRGIEALRDAGLDVAFVTNGTGLDREALLERLAAAGVPRDAGPVVSSAAATAEYLRETDPDASVFVAGQRPVVDELERVGLTVVDADSGPADVLVAGRCPDLSEALLTDVIRAVDPDTRFVATNADGTHPVEGGMRPGAGATVGAIRGMLGREPTVVGKPAARMAETAASLLDVDTADCLVIGDRLETDVEMGNDAGMTTVLVLTGASARRDVDERVIEPDHVIESLSDVRRVL